MIDLLKIAAFLAGAWIVILAVLLGLLAILIGILQLRRDEIR